MAESVKAETQKTGNDLSGLANSKTMPSHTAVNGQPLTHYHSFFYSLLTVSHVLGLRHGSADKI